VRVLEARVRLLGESADVVVGHVIWPGGQDDGSPVVQMDPSLACDAESSALLCQLWYFVKATAPKSFERLPRMQIRYWSFADVSASVSAREPRCR